eukprot:gene12397-14347_t
MAVDDKDRNLISAAREGQYELIVSLVENNGVPVDFQETMGSATALMVAAQMGFVEIVMYLLLKGADPNIQDRENRTALIGAAMNHQIACIKPLMEHGANPNLYSKNGWTALYIAANRGFTSIVKELVSAYGVRQNADGTTPVHRLGIDMNIQNTVGGNVLMVACMQGHLEIVKVLIACGADVNAKNNNNWTALMKAADKGHTQVVAHLIQKGADVTNADKSGFTALHLAAKANMTETVKLLLDSASASAIINEQDLTLRTALFYAAQNGHLEAVKTLMKYGADPSIPDKAQRTAHTVAKDPTGQILQELSAVLISALPFTQTVAESVQVDPTDSKRQKTQEARGDRTVAEPLQVGADTSAAVAIAIAAQPSPLLSASPAPASSLPTETVSRKRARSEISEADDKHARAFQLDEEYIAAWCGDSAAHNRLYAAKEEPLACGYAALLKLLTWQYYDVEEGSRLALKFLQWLRLADCKENPHAQFVFAVLQYHGVAMMKNIPSAVAMLLKLSLQGHANAQCVLARHYRDASKGLLHPEEQSRRWYTAAAAKDHPEALFRIGQLALSDEDCTEDEQSAAVKLLQRAVARGHPSALQLMGDRFRHGVGVAIDEGQAFQHYQKAAWKNDVFGSFCVGECYKYEVGTSSNPVEEAKFYMKAADQGHTEACLRAGGVYFNGVKHPDGTSFIERNDAAAVAYLQRATLNEDSESVAEAKYALGVMTMHGLGTVPDADRAEEYLTDASTKGHTLAQIDLACHLAVTVNTEDSREDAKSLLAEVMRLNPDLPLAVLTPLLRGRQDQRGRAVHMRFLEGDLDAGYTFKAEVDPQTSDTENDMEFKDAAFLPDAQWIQDTAPLLKVGWLLLVLHPADSHDSTTFDEQLALRLLQRPLRQTPRTVTLVCEAEKAIDKAVFSVGDIEDFEQVPLPQKRKFQWKHSPNVVRRRDF